MSSFDSPRNELSNGCKHAASGLVNAARSRSENRYDGRSLASSASAARLRNATEAPKIFIFYVITARKVAKLREVDHY